MSDLENTLAQIDPERFFDSLLTPNGGARFAGEDFRRLSGPCVYMFLLRGQALYVGMSRRGLSRTAGLHIQADEARRLCDEVLIWATGTEKNALLLEAFLTLKLNPRFNKNNTGHMAKIKNHITPEKIRDTATILGITPRTAKKYVNEAHQQNDDRWKEPILEPRKAAGLPEKAASHGGRNPSRLRFHDFGTLPIIREVRR